MKHLDKATPSFVIIIGGPSGSGKTTLSKYMLSILANSICLHMDDFYYKDGLNGKYTVGDDGKNYLDKNNPCSIDLISIKSYLADVMLRFDYIILEGIFALVYTELEVYKPFKVYVDMPDDLSILRKLIRKFEEGVQNPRDTFRNYVNSGRPGLFEHIKPSMRRADVIVSGVDDLEVSARIVKEAINARTQ